MVWKLHKIHCSRFLCTLCTVTVENSIVLPLRTKIAVQKGLGTTCLLVRGIPVLITNNDIFRAVLPIKNVCVQSFGPGLKMTGQLDFSLVKLCF